jgi:probable HAF family extracellular repeat protein
VNIQLFRAIRPSNVRSANRTKSKTLMLATAITVLATLPISVGLSAQQKFTTIDVPGATLTIAFGINPRGDIVGLYLDTSGNEHGFLLSNGTFTTIDVPGAISTNALGINPRGDIVGGYGDTSINFHGFLLSKGKFTTIDVPGAVQTEAIGNNPQGDIVGGYVDTSGNFHGFLLSR